eukprot:gene15802-24141_t
MKSFALVGGALAAAIWLAGAADDCDYPTAAPVLRTDPPVRISGTRFVDRHGRIITLRGVNTAGNSKVPPFTPVRNGTLDPLPGWGLNYVRLLFTWEAFEPERCQYNASYLDYYKNAVRNAADLGLLVMVDFHQDAYSRFTNGGCGEGAPYWAVHSSIERDVPDNGPDCEHWGITMIGDPKTITAWDEFHKDSEGARDRYLKMTARVAAELAGEPNVFSYHLLNEPWGSDADLFDLYYLVQESIRRYDPNATVIVPPHALLSGAGPNKIPASNFTNYAYGPNYYSVFAFAGVGDPSPRRRLLEHQAHADGLGVPLIFGEFGIQPTQDIAVTLIREIYDYLDESAGSGAYWSYTPDWTPGEKDGWNAEDFSIVDDKGELRGPFVPRPYAVSIAGEPAEQTAAAYSYRFAWVNDAAKGATEFYVPAGFLDDAAVSVTAEAGGALPADTCAFASAFVYSCSVAGSGRVELLVEKPFATSAPPTAAPRTQAPPTLAPTQAPATRHPETAAPPSA